jgi:ribonuclease HI
MAAGVRDIASWTLSGADDRGMKRSPGSNRAPAPTIVVPSGTVIAATDGSCLKNPGGASGWAWYVNETCWAAGGITSGTNQVAELMAVLAVLRSVPADLPLHVRADSQYALQACQTWIRGWKAKGWKRAGNQPVMNLELMQDLDRAMATRTGKLTWEWVRGHNGDRMNQRADDLCGDASHAVRARQTVNPGPGWNPSGLPAGSLAASAAAAGSPAASPVVARAAAPTLFDVPPQPPRTAARTPAATIPPLFPDTGY